MSLERLAAALAKRRPPNFHETPSRTRNCHMCRHVNRTTGICVKYAWPVDRDDVCDSFEPRADDR